MYENYYKIIDYCSTHFNVEADLKITMNNCYIGLATRDKAKDYTALGLGFYTFSFLPKLLFKYNISKVESCMDFDKTSDSNVACIGYSEDNQGWLGWSHRACFFFKIGYVVKEGSLCTHTGFIEEYAKQHPERCFNLPVGFTCKTLDDCRKCAIAFAMAVS